MVTTSSIAFLLSCIYYTISYLLSPGSYRAFANPPVEMLSGTDPLQLFADVLSEVRVMTISPPTRNVS